MTHKFTRTALYFLGLTVTSQAISAMGSEVNPSNISSKDATPYNVTIVSDIAESYHAIPSAEQKNMALASVRMAVDVENTTLQELVDNIVHQAAEHTGPWRVKWRLKPENKNLLTTRVNLLAEGSFNDFTFHLAERIKNMTGTQLFFSHFNAARVIVVSDTYY